VYVTTEVVIRIKSVYHDLCQQLRKIVYPINLTIPSITAPSGVVALKPTLESATCDRLSVGRTAL
jgi:hypothetical protein